MSKSTLLGVVSEWWQWSEQDVADFRAWASLNRDEAVIWLRQEAERALAQQQAGIRHVDEWIAQRDRRHAA
jgi:hypothetical protein